MTRTLTETQRGALLQQIPLGRLGKPEDVAAVVAFSRLAAGRLHHRHDRSRQRRHVHELRGAETTTVMESRFRLDRLAGRKGDSATMRTSRISIAAKQGEGAAMENVEQRVKKIVAEQLGVNEAEIKSGSSFVDDSARTRSTPSNS